MSRTYRLLHSLVIVALLLAMIGQALPTQAAPVERSSWSEPLAQRATKSSQTQPGIDPLETPAAHLLPAASRCTSTVRTMCRSRMLHYPLIGSGAFTLEAWIYPTNVTGFHAVFGKMLLALVIGSACTTASCASIGAAARLSKARRASRPIAGRTSWSRPTTSLTPAATYAEFYINGDREGVYEHAGAAAVGGTYDLHIGNDQTFEYFVGDIAEARLWYGARGSESTRHDMNTALTEKRPGLIADWHLTGDFKDAINGIDGTPVGSPAFVGFPSPAQPAVAQTDRFFNTLPQATYAAGTAFVPRLNRAILAGGYRAGVPSTAITSVDAGSGAATNIGTFTGGPRVCGGRVCRLE